MSKAVYIATSTPESGKSIIALGLMRMLLGKTEKVGYFRPVIDDYHSGKKDNHIDPDIFDIFIKNKVYLEYAEEFLDPEQIDTIDEKLIPGYL